MQVTPDIALLKGLLEIYSPSLEERPAAEYLCEQMAQRGLDAHIDAAGNAVGVIGSGPREIVLLGHMDTVPGFIDVRIEDGQIYGRGSVDAKGPLCSFVAAAGRLATQPEALGDKRLVVVGAVEEEYATSKGAHQVLDDYAARGVVPYACIIGEPSAWDRITLGYKGRILIDYSQSRPVQHTAGRGHSVIEDAVDFWTALRDQARAYSEGKATFDMIDPSLRKINSFHDGFTERVEATFAFRLPVGFTPDDLIVWARKAQSELEPDDRAEIHFRGPELAYRSPKNTPLVRAYLNAIRKAGGEPGFKVKTGTSDMNVVGPVWGCPILAYGPGDSALDHTPNEHLSLDEYVHAINVLEQALRAL